MPHLPGPPLAFIVLAHVAWWLAGPAAAQVMDTTNPRHSLGNGGPAAAPHGPGGTIDTGPWPTRGVPRPFNEPAGNPVIARLAGPALVNAGRVDRDLTQACRERRVALPRPRPRAMVGENTFMAAFGRDLVGARGGALPDTLYIFQYADANRCTVWEAGGPG